jgi:hypothetical protein
VDSVEVGRGEDANMITVGMTYDVAEFVPVAIIEVILATELVVAAVESVLSVDTAELSVVTAEEGCEEVRPVVAGFVLGDVSVGRGWVAAVSVEPAEVAVGERPEVAPESVGYTLVAMPVAPEVVAWPEPVTIGGRFVSRPEDVGKPLAVVVGTASGPV